MAQAPPPADLSRRGRPRSEATRKAILRAAGELLIERDLNSISMDAVAEHAGASKATIYRWWSSKELLALDALFSEWEPAGPGTHDTGTLTGDLNGLIRPWARQLAAKPYARVIAALITKAQNDPEFAEQYHARFVEPRRDQARAIFARAISRGEIPLDTDIESALDLLYGPIYHRVLHGHAKLTDSFTSTVVDYVAAGAAHPTAQAQRTDGTTAGLGQLARKGRSKAPE
jgi:AcrR family transcriptional regulator